MRPTFSVEREGGQCMPTFFGRARGRPKAVSADNAIQAHEPKVRVDSYLGEYRGKAEVQRQAWVGRENCKDKRGSGVRRASVPADEWSKLAQAAPN